MTSNGAGMGHLVRMLAVAKRCSSRIQPIFLTMSQALGVVRDQGYLAEFLPFRTYLGVDSSAWNKHFEEELNALITFYDPSVVVFDGSVPYRGLIDAIQSNPDPLFVWCRRGMWRRNNDDSIIKRERHFDAVIEPGELANAFDQGATAAYQSRTVQVPPIRFLDDDEMLSRGEARNELELDQHRPAALVLLSSGNSFDFSHLRRIAIDRLVAAHDAQVVLGEWAIAAQEREQDAVHKRLSSFPFSRHFKAFDLVISALGYNSFHEILFTGVPVIFVPNEDALTDNQAARGSFAERRGFGLMVRTREVYRMSEAIDRLLDPEQRAFVAQRAAAMEPINGAGHAARLIEEMAFSRRTDRDLMAY
ncbi:MAG: glycosyltransferase [Geminicoccaceae bacterium]